MDSKFWDSEEVLGVVKKSGRAEYRVSKVSRNRNEFLAIREWYEDSQGEYRPANLILTYRYLRLGECLLNCRVC